jgi:uncharacterized DUF497 family protein
MPTGPGVEVTEDKASVMLKFADGSFGSIHYLANGSAAFPKERMDVDKGDYLPRDSYHCGVNYGVYDHHFLWDNVVITDSFQMGVLPKAALEAWSLALARHKMFNYVYKHHVRNITDALLVEILQLAFDRLEQTRESRDILPLRSHHDVNRDECIHKFVHWTDNSLIKAVDSFDDPDLSSKIEAFSSRKLYKRGFSLNLSDYSNAVGNEPEVLGKVNELRDEMSRKGMDWNAIPVPEVLMAKHGIDFRDAERFFNAEPICFEDCRQDYNEKRFIAFGKIEERLIITVYTLRDDNIRIISMRKANARERRLYEQYIQNRLEKG